MKALENMEYPGRFLILGRDMADRNNIAIYGVTGRSPMSRARKMLSKGKSDYVKWNVDVLDRTKVDEEKLPLIVYNSLETKGYDTLVVSNGAQTDLISKFAFGNDKSPQSILIKSFSVSSSPYNDKKDYIIKTKDDEIDITSYEPDSLNTPRISGVIKNNKSSLSIIKREGSELPCRSYTPSMKIKPGKGKLIATYNGNRKNPLPFKREPLNVDLEGSVNDIAQEVWDSLNPELRVAVGCIFIDEERKTIENKLIPS